MTERSGHESEFSVGYRFNCTYGILKGKPLGFLRNCRKGHFINLDDLSNSAVY